MSVTALFFITLNRFSILACCFFETTVAKNSNARTNKISVPNGFPWLFSIVVECDVEIRLNMRPRIHGVKSA